MPTAKGGSVTLDTVATIEMGSGAAQITRFDRQRSVSIKADVAGANNASKSQTALPTGVVAALSGNVHPTIQLVTSDGFCLGATMTEATTDDGLQYKARKKLP